jgi:hypothetical protein
VKLYLIYRLNPNKKNLPIKLGQIIILLFFRIKELTPTKTYKIKVKLIYIKFVYLSSRNLLDFVIDSIQRFGKLHKYFKDILFKYN